MAQIIKRVRIDKNNNIIEKIKQEKEEIKELILKVSEFSKSFGVDVLFENTELLIHKSDKVSLIGQNGCGKTTFIKCILGEEEYLGNIEINSIAKISVMEQEKIFENSNKTFNQYLEDKKQKLVKKQEEIEEKFNDPNIYDDTILYEKLLLDYSNIQNRSEKNIDEEKIKNILTEINFEMKDYNKTISSLSGGQKTKLRIAETLSKDAEFYILDEPTNHLDFETLYWLEKWVKNSDKTFLIVSHDRYFINRISNKIVEIEDEELISYNCSYNLYKKRKKERHTALQNKYESVAREKRRLKKSEEMKRYWAHLVGSKKMKIQADNMKRRSENLGEHKNPEDFLDNFKLEFKTSGHLQNTIFKADDLSKSFGEHIILDNTNFIIEKGQKIAILGKNGVGKTTLLKILSNIDKNYSGSIKRAPNLEIGYLDQEFENLDKKQKVMEFLWEADSKLMEHEIIGTLIKFGFNIDKINEKLEKLSGGEKTRVCLVKLMLSNCNILLLDEPTNNLDLELIESLENALKDFTGTVLFVSHDRRFINNLAEKLFIIKEKKINILEGNLEDNS